jgi:AraC family transcriptional regulator
MSRCEKPAGVNCGQDAGGSGWQEGRQEDAMLIGKALWMIESNLAAPVSLSGIARLLGVTRFHLARSFAETTGQPLMRYVWRRRLTRAAEALAYGEAPILTVALDALYASPEAFSRAFRAEFGMSPRSLRQSRAIENLTLTQPFIWSLPMSPTLPAPKIEMMPKRRFAGLVRRYDMQTRAEIPAQWAAYDERDTSVAGPVSDNYYGLCFNFSEAEGSFDYLCGQEVPQNVALPEGFSAQSIDGAYARFTCKGHISTIQAAWGEIYGHWLTTPDYAPRHGAAVEYYPPEFDGRTGDGGFEIWVPVKG